MTYVEVKSLRYFGVVTQPRRLESAECCASVRDRNHTFLPAFPTRKNYETLAMKQCLG